MLLYTLQRKRASNLTHSHIAVTSATIALKWNEIIFLTISIMSMCELVVYENSWEFFFVFFLTIFIRRLRSVYISSVKEIHSYKIESISHNNCIYIYRYFGIWTCTRSTTTRGDKSMTYSTRLAMQQFLILYFIVAHIHSNTAMHNSYTRNQSILLLDHYNGTYTRVYLHTQPHEVTYTIYIS